MNKEQNNMDNYIKSLEQALSNAKAGSSLNILFQDFEKCNKNLEFVLSEDKFKYGMEEELIKRTYIQKIEKCSDEGIHFVLSDLLPHRLDYHNLGYKRAANINYTYFSGYQRDAFDFIRDNDIVPAESKMFLLFVNYYNDEEEDSSNWDNDNLDVKVFIDSVISKKFVVDDRHDLLSYCMLSKKGESTHTEAYLVKEEKIISLFNTIFTR